MLSPSDVADLEPDDDVMFRFLQTWFSPCNHGVVELGWTDEHNGKLTLFRRFALDDLTAAARFAAETNARAGASMYFRPATVQPGPKYTTDDDVVQIPGCWADCDTTEAIDRLLAGDIAPTFQVITGRIPGLRAQFLWRFSNDPLLVPEWSREINRRIHTLAGGDPAVINPSTLLRLPGSIAWPWKAGRQPELTECIIPGGGHRVSLASLQAKLPQVATVPAPDAADSRQSASTAEILNPIQALIDQARAGPKWHNPVLKLVAMLVARGTPSSVVLAMAEHLTWPKYTVQQTREDLAAMIDGARRKGFDEWDCDDDPATEVDDIVDDVMNVPPKPPAPGLGIWNAGQDDYQISPRGWLLGTMFCRRFLSSLIADGGVGKTAVRMLQLISLATGRPLSGEHVFRRCRVPIVSFEDDKDELRRRVHAVMRHHDIAAADLDNWLFLSAPKGLKLIVQGNNGATQIGALRQLLIDAIERHQIDVVSLDPFIKTHGLEENDNNAIDLVCELLATIAIEHDCSVDLPHHTKKGMMAAGNADAGRGATSMKDAARLLYTLTPMSQIEAGWFGIAEKDRRSLIRLDSGKVNIAPPTDAAAWFRLVGVPLGNATSEYPNGDEVQTVERWDPPDVWSQLDPAVLNRILDELGAELPDGSRYSAEGNVSATNAAWGVVRRHVPSVTEEQAKGIIRTWLKSGLLFVQKYTNPNTRHQRNGLWVDDSKRPT